MNEITLDEILQLSRSDLAHLLSASEAEGFRFVRRVLDEWQGGVHRFDGPGECLLGARVGATTVGICGLMLDPYARKEGMGRLRNLYVLPDFRRRGVGEALSRRVIAAARGTFRTLRLRAGTPEAARLYDRLGFLAVDDVAECTHLLDLG